MIEGNLHLTHRQYEAMSILFKMFGDETRLRIMKSLFESEKSVQSLATDLAMTPSAISHQLGTLRKTHLVTARKEGKNVYYALADDHVKLIFKMALDHISE